MHFRQKITTLTDIRIIAKITLKHKKNNCSINERRARFSVVAREKRAGTSTMQSLQRRRMALIGTPCHPVSVVRCSPSIVAPIEELNHQDYNGKRVILGLTDRNNTRIGAKLDIGVHSKNYPAYTRTFNGIDP